MTFINNILFSKAQAISISNTISTNIDNKALRHNHNSLYMSFLSGLDIGIPLNIFQNIFTNLHYGYDITNAKSIGLQFLVGYYTYTKDRYNDALKFIEIPYNVSKKKEDLYYFINENLYFYKITIPFSYILFSYLLISDSIGIEQFIIRTPFLPFLFINGEYQSYKKYLNEMKAIYIAFMWTIATVVMPCVLYSNDYSILQYPLDF